MSRMDSHPWIDDEWFERISASVDGELSPDEEAETAAHLASCAPCRELRARLEDQRRRSRLWVPIDREDLVEAIVGARVDDRAVERAATVRLVRRAAIAAVAVAASVFALHGLARPAPVGDQRPSELAGPVLVRATDHAFDQPRIEVPRGTTVEWVNNGSTTHNLVRHLGGATVEERLPPGRVETATFDQPGTYQFLCTVHAGMRGTLTVDS